MTENEKIAKRFFDKVFKNDYYEKDDLEFKTLVRILNKKDKASENTVALANVSQQRELLLAYHKHLDSFNDVTIYNAPESMIDDYLANNSG